MEVTIRYTNTKNNYLDTERSWALKSILNAWITRCYVNSCVRNWFWCPEVDLIPKVKCKWHPYDISFWKKIQQEGSTYSYDNGKLRKDGESMANAQRKCSYRLFQLLSKLKQNFWKDKLKFATVIQQNKIAVNYFSCILVDSFVATIVTPMLFHVN